MYEGIHGREIYEFYRIFAMQYDPQLCVMHRLHWMYSLHIHANVYINRGNSLKPLQRIIITIDNIYGKGWLNPNCCVTITNLLFSFVM